MSESPVNSLDLNNLSTWDDTYLRQVVEWIIADLELKGRIKFWFMSTWTAITDEGDLIPGSEQDTAFDGDWTEGGIVRVVISDRITYPHIWEINRALPGLYLRRINTFYTPSDFFIYFAAHELRHEYQEQNPEKAKAIRLLLRCDDETDADIYATMTLCRFRATAAGQEVSPIPEEAEKTMHPFLRPQFEDGETIGFEFWCPGCASIDPTHGLHVFTVLSEDEDGAWEYDGGASFEPSLAYESVPECHLHLTDGVLHFYPDCAHKLAGTNVPMVPIPPGDHEERE